MSSLESEWKEYVRLTYVGGLNGANEIKIRHAFLAGMLALISLTNERDGDMVAGAALICDVVKAARDTARDASRDAESLSTQQSN